MDRSMEQLFVMKPPEDDSVILEYVALRKDPFDYVCKTLVVKEEPKGVQDCPLNLMSIETATSYLDYFLQPVMMCRDPFRKGRCKLVLCEIVSQDQGTSKSSRDQCKEVMESKFKDDEVWLGFEQEYTIVDHQGVPLEWDMYCQNTASVAGTHSGLFRGRLVGEQRHLTDTHLRACLYAGLSMYGCQREGHVSMWEYQIGPTLALDCADQLHVSRFILMRLCEMMKVFVNFDTPKCVTQVGLLHTNFSTKNMRAPGGIKHINAALDNLASVPQESLFKYYDSVDGAGAKTRLTGFKGYPKVDKFLVSLGNKDSCSIRIPAKVVRAGWGYFEERRVGLDADPYAVARMLTIAALSPSDVE